MNGNVDERRRRMGDRIVLPVPPVFDERSPRKRPYGLTLVKLPAQRERDAHWFALASGLLVGMLLGFALATIVLP
jgi:hypothetical protein